MSSTIRTALLVAMVSLPVSSTLADATPVRSSVESFSEIVLAGVDESDRSDQVDTQADEIGPLGPVPARTTIDSQQGYYFATAESSASFQSPDQGTFQSQLAYIGIQGEGDIDAQSYRHSLDGIFEYDFTNPADGTLNISGSLFNSGPSVLSYYGFIQVFSEDELGSGFGQSYFDYVIYDIDFNSAGFNVDVPLDAQSGSYRVLIRISHNGLTQLNSPVNGGSLQASWAINAKVLCPADINEDGDVNFFDFSAFFAGFANRDPIADFNNDSAVDFFDVSGFLIAITLGCE